MNYSALIRPTATIIKVRLDYYGDKSYGKRVYWIVDENEFIWKQDFEAWKKEKEEQNYKIVFVK